jgi:uncharacterized membrane protein
MSTSRIEAFSDSIFAVVLTLLVLEVHVPQVDDSDVSHELAHRVLSMAPKFLAYGLSFVIICVWWVAHHHLFRVLARSDRGLLWINCLFLLWLSFIPFPTAMIGDYPKEAFAVMSYGAVMTLAGLSFCLMRYYTFFGADLVDQRIDKSLLKRAMLRSALNPLLHAIAVAIAPLSTRAAIVLYAILPVVFFVPSGLERHSLPKPAAHH